MNKQLVFILFTFVPFLSWASINSCEHLFLPWYEIPGILRPVEGYLIPNADPLIKFDQYSDLKNFDDKQVLLSKHFLDEAGLDVPAGSKKVQMGTYAYYPEGSISKRRSKGSGRGHLLLQKNMAGDLIEYKGSGINQHFKLPFELELQNYRENGLAVLDESLLEVVTGRILQKSGVPIAMSFELKLMPELIQDVANSSTGYDKAATQISRVMNEGRDSHYPGLEASLEEKAKLLGSVYALNAQLGAINPENMSFGAKLLDLGHLNIGYPLTSGAYRCTICKANDGSSMDKTMKGFIDHYFENLPSKSLSNGELKRAYSDHEKISEKLTIYLRNYAPAYTIDDVSIKTYQDFQLKEKVYMSYQNFRNFGRDYSHLQSFNTWFDQADIKNRHKAYLQYTQENFRVNQVAYSGFLRREEAEAFIKKLLPVEASNFRLGSSEYLGLVTALEEKLFLKDSIVRQNKHLTFAEQILGIDLPDNVKPHRVALSLRSLMQFAALKKFLSQEQYAHTQSLLQSIVKKRSWEDTQVLLRMFERAFESSTPKDLKQLYQEYYPSNVTFEAISDKLKKSETRGEAIATVKNLVDTYTRPIQVSPINYYLALKEMPL